MTNLAGGTSQSVLLRFRFGMRRLLLATAYFSLVCALIFAAPGRLTPAMIIVAAVLFATALMSGIVYGRGNVRAFCIGAIFPIALIVITASCVCVCIAFESYGGGRVYGATFKELGNFSVGMRLLMGIGSILAPIAGILSVALREYLRNRR